MSLLTSTVKVPLDTPIGAKENVLEGAIGAPIAAMAALAAVVPRLPRFGIVVGIVVGYREHDG